MPGPWHCKRPIPKAPPPPTFDDDEARAHAARRLNEVRAQYGSGRLLEPVANLSDPGHSRPKQ